MDTGKIDECYCAPKWRTLLPERIQLNFDILKKLQNYVKNHKKALQTYKKKLSN